MVKELCWVRASVLADEHALWCMNGYNTDMLAESIGTNTLQLSEPLFSTCL